MGFFVSDKVDHKHGWPSFDFVTKTDKGTKVCTVFPKESSFKTWDEQDRATDMFRRKLWGLGKKADLNEPFPTSIWHQYIKHFDSIPSTDVQEYKVKRVNEENEENEPQQTDLFNQVVKKAMRTTQERVKELSRALREDRIKGPQKRPSVIIPKKGPGSYQREKNINLEKEKEKV